MFRPTARNFIAKLDSLLSFSGRQLLLEMTVLKKTYLYIFRFPNFD